MVAGLKLKAQRVEDLRVISACLQDAVVTVGDMAYLPADRRFALMANRFVREEQNEQGEACHRVRAGVHFDGVLNVAVRDIPQRRKDKVLELLAIEAIPGEDAAATIILVFAGGGSIRLDVECIDCHLTDVSEPWPTQCRPCHPVVE